MSTLCDANVWLALTLSAHAHHEHAARWLGTVQEPDSVLFCRATQQALLRLLTNAAVLPAYGNPPLTNAEALAVYDAFQSDDRIAFAEEPEALDRPWRELSDRSTASPKLWMDAYLAAFAQTAGHRLLTTDKAFRQFSGLGLDLLGS